jgi:hypothetical protein
VNNEPIIKLTPLAYLGELNQRFKNLIKNEKWKNISIKVIDLISTICQLKRFSSEYENQLVNFLTSIQQTIQLPSNVWFRYMQIIEEKI